MRDEPDEAQRLRASKDEAILAILARLALHYWRPDFTPGQARQLYRDYLDDLRDFAVVDINRAIQVYRRDGANRFFPTTGQIVDLISGKADLIREFGPNGPTDMAQALARRRSAAVVAGREEMADMLERRALAGRNEATKNITHHREPA